MQRISGNLDASHRRTSNLEAALSSERQKREAADAELLSTQQRLLKCQVAQVFVNFKSYFSKLVNALQHANKASNVLEAGAKADSMSAMNVLQVTHEPFLA